MTEAGLIGHSYAVKDPNDRNIQSTTDPSILHRLEPMVSLAQTSAKMGSLVMILCHASRYSFISAFAIVGVRLCFSVHMPIGRQLSHLLPIGFERLPDYDPYLDIAQRIYGEVESNKEELRLFGLADRMLKDWEFSRMKLKRRTSLPLITIFGHAELELLLFVGLHVRVIALGLVDANS